VPKPIEQWWVQRWLELTDIETPYINGLPLVSNLQLLRELSNWQLSIEGRPPQWRTLYFLLSEIGERCFRDEALRFCMGWQLGDDIYACCDKIRQALDGRFDCVGNKRSDQEPSSEELKVMAHLVNSALERLETDNEYLKSLVGCIIGIQQQQPETSNLCDLPGDTDAICELDMYTQTLILELVIKHNHTLPYLKERCLTAFLRPDRDTTFLDRMYQFFTTLIGQQHQFDVYVRMQVKRDILRIDTVGDISFAERLPQMSGLIQQLRRNGKLSQDDEERARRFFYDGQDNPHHIFVRIVLQRGFENPSKRSR
jgi:hypothetical protein